MNKSDIPIDVLSTADNNENSCCIKTRTRNKRQRFIHIISIFLITLILFFFAVLVKAYFNGEFRSVDAFQKYIGKYGAFGPIFLTVFQSAQVVIPVLPGFLGCAVGSFMFGPAVGFWCNYIGISSGSVIAFFLARKYGMPILEDLFPSGKYSKWATWASKSKSYTVFLFMTILLPLFPDDYLCYLTGISKMTTKRFIWIIILAKPWCIMAYSLGFTLIK